jgi:hypothetical protein
MRASSARPSTPGTTSAANTPMITTTTMISIRVKPTWRRACPLEARESEGFMADKQRKRQKDEINELTQAGHHNLA